MVRRQPSECSADLTSEGLDKVKRTLTVLEIWTQDGWLTRLRWTTVLSALLLLKSMAQLEIITEIRLLFDFQVCFLKNWSCKKRAEVVRPKISFYQDGKRASLSDNFGSREFNKTVTRMFNLISSNSDWTTFPSAASRSNSFFLVIAPWKNKKAQRVWSSIEEEKKLAGFEPV